METIRLVICLCIFVLLLNVGHGKPTQVDTSKGNININDIVSRD